MPRGVSPARFRIAPSPARLRLFCSILGSAALLSGCGNPAPTISHQAPAITREMVAAARAATNGRAEIAAKQSGENTADRIFITLPVERDGRPDASLLPALELQLDRVARAHRLQRVPQKGSPGVIRFDYQRAGQRTQTVEIIVPIGRQGVPGENGAGPRLAVIVDDLGSEHAPAESLLSLSVPLTLSVLPQLPYSEVIAEEAGRRGFEVLLHLQSNRRVAKALGKRNCAPECQLPR